MPERRNVMGQSVLCFGLGIDPEHQYLAQIKPQRMHIPGKGGKERGGEKELLRGGGRNGISGMTKGN